MRVRRDFPHAVETVGNVWVPLSDGERLAARIYLPEGARDDPVPAILEYTPYRKNDWTAPNDRQTHAYFAGHGYASMRDDVRGSGDSGGLLLDEYLPQEQEDAVELLAWIAAQPWCSGSVGMMGYSWGGFNALQVAARRPPSLKSIISYCSTDDRYADDVHYMGGCVLGEWMLRWATMFLTWNARPPDPLIAGDSWRDMWMHRLHGCHPVIEPWLRHQRRDDYWQQGSVCEDYGAIECPVYMVGGWADGYTNAVLRFLENFDGVKKGLIGPWGHTWPHMGAPGPAIGFLQECLRWWDQWLKGIDNGIMDEPLLTAWMQDSVRPEPHYRVRPGRWVRNSWPDPEITTCSYYLGGETLSREQPRESVRTVASNEDVGLDGGDWLPFGRDSDLPRDQQVEDCLSLSCTSEPLTERLEILGFPEVRLELAADQPQAQIAVRLCDVGPGGESTLVTRALMNLSHRDGHEDPMPLEPGRRYSVRVRLNAAGYAFPPGHRIRVAISPSYWPFAWPSPHSTKISLFGGSGSTLTLPVRLPEVAYVPPHFHQPECAEPLATEILVAHPIRRTLTRDLGSGRLDLDVLWSYFGTRRLLDNGHVNGDSYRENFAIVEGNPLSASARCEYASTNSRDDWNTRVDATSTLTATERSFDVTVTLDAQESNRRVFAKTWAFSIPRDQV